jgi:CHAT domain-containing protein/Tfp pilus assembly protein PilF
MIRGLRALGLVMVCVAVLAVATSAVADELLSPAERAKLQKRAEETNQRMDKEYRSGHLPEAVRLARQTLEIYERIYPAKEYPDGHPYLALSLNNLGFFLQGLGQPTKALTYFEKALAMRKRLYPPHQFPNGHPYLALSLNNLGHVLQALGQHTEALPYFEKALAMRQRVYPADKFPDGHAELAQSLNSLAFVLQALGQPTNALSNCEKALAMRERLYPPDKFPDGHAELAESLNNLGGVLQDLGQPAKALKYFEKALAMRERLYPRDKFPDGHAEVARCLNNLGLVLQALGRAAIALPYFEKALAMRERLYPQDKFQDGHPDLARSLNNLGCILQALGQPAKALPCLEKALAMNERLYPPDEFPDGHADLAVRLNNLGHVLMMLGQPTNALPRLKQAVAIYLRWAAKELAGAPEAQALAFFRSFPRSRDAYLQTSLGVPGESIPEIYAQVWPFKGLLFQLAARRHQAVLAAASDSPNTRRQWERLQAVRGRLAHLFVATAGLDRAAHDLRLTELTDEQEKLERDLAKQLPELDRSRQLAALGPADLALKLPPETAFIDFVRHADFGNAKFTGYHYQAFVLAPGQPIHRVDLGPAKPIDDAIISWRRAIDRCEPSLAPQKLKDQVWDRLSAGLPPGTKTVYLCPESHLARMPWAALPGNKPGTVLLEDLRLAVVTSGSWLLEQLLFRQKDANGPDTLVAAGAIDYGTPSAGAKAAYAPLGGTDRELERVLEAFGSGEGAALRQQAATPAALKERLPKARYAHLATHAYFDEHGLAAERRRAREQLEKWAYHANLPTERVGLGAKNPLGYVGLALAGANDPKQAGPDGGILTGLGIVDLRLENLRLCVLSACETGLGELTEGEGMVGLQRAFHVAGCPNVVGSLWTVDDAATAALMAQFYHELCVNKQSPLEALRAAQLTIYRHPDRIPALVGERGKPALNAAAKLGPAAGPPVKNEKPATAPTRLWAAFVLSGVGQ